MKVTVPSAPRHDNQAVSRGHIPQNRPQSTPDRVVRQSSNAPHTADYQPTLALF